ncbi:uncharacterized protein V1510DRAFT_422731 [Dipodascopsis tothii]|uniref:uncharacterized protein n=1 Tax=Dipodascopsis tothii TaxID=44089 RepID=UPI0034CDBCEA
MGEPIRNKRISDLSNAAPTPQNTPASNTYIASRASEPSVSTIQEEDKVVSGLANNPALLSMIQGKLGSLVGKPSGYIASLPVAVRTRISGLKGIQKEYTKLETEFRKEITELEKKYAELYKPLYEKRSSIVAGVIEPTDQEVEAGKEEEEDEDDDDEQDEQVKSTIPEDAKGIPEFWLTALKNMIAFSESITDKDEEVLKNLVDVRLEYLEKPGFRLVFEFSQNEYFTNSVLTKTYYYQEQTAYSGDYVYDHAVGDEIKWKEGKNLTVKIEKKKQRNKHTKATRIVERTIPTESFFNFFSPPIAPEDEDDEDDIPEDLEERLELDYQLGEEIKDKLIPRAIDWYTGEALEYEDFDDLDQDDLNDSDDDDEDDSDEDDDDENDSDEEGDSKPKQEAAECKQS